MNTSMLNKFHAEAEPYFDGPFMRRFPDEALDGNSILYTSVYTLIKKRLFGLEKEDKNRIESMYVASMVIPGKISRGPHKAMDRQAHDDYIGLTAASYAVDDGIADDIAMYGAKNGWTWEQGDFRSFFGRFLGFAAHVKASAEWIINPIEQIMWSIDILWTVYREPETSVSGKILDWVRVQVMKDQGYFITSLAIKLWEKKIRKDYPNLMGDVFACYYERVTPSNGMYQARHLFTRWMRGIL